jgi:hypothetical protein
MDTNNTVYEYTEFASENYIGTRFISSNPKEGDELPQHLKIIASNLTMKDAQALCSVTRDKNLYAFEQSLPEDLREIASKLF